MHNCWIEYDHTSDFSLYNLPYGVFRYDGRYGVGVAIGDQVIDMTAVAHIEQFQQELKIPAEVFARPVLNDYIAQGPAKHREVRKYLTRELTDVQSYLRDHQVLLSQSDVEMVLPVRVPNYTDFYSSRDHATNVGKMFRDPENALLPNWLHMPVAYHGRASSIVVSGTDLHRPCGQQMPKDAETPVYGPCRLLDFELEMAFIIGKANELGRPISTADADDHIFGLVLFNDWSARDIQKWEYVPLGPFLGKNWGSSVSPWVVPLDAIEKFRVPGPAQSPEVLPYLKYEGDRHYDISLEVAIQPDDMDETTIVRSNYRHLYWNMAQQLAHHTINGCNMQIGDMLASGTISGPTESSFGSMLELSWAGKKDVELVGGQKRKFIHDGDRVIMRAFAQNNDCRVGFGEVRTKILPSHKTKS